MFGTDYETLEGAYCFLWRLAKDGPGEETRKWAQEWIDWHERVANEWWEGGNGDDEGAYWSKPEHYVTMAEPA
jgi:hypothetical protein